MVTQLQSLQAFEVSSKRLSKEELKKMLMPLQSVWDSLKESIKPAPKAKESTNKDPVYAFVKLEISKA